MAIMVVGIAADIVPFHALELLKARFGYVGYVGYFGGFGAVLVVMLSVVSCFPA